MSWHARRWVLLGAACLGIALVLLCLGRGIVAPVVALAAGACWMAALCQWNLTQALRESDRLKRQRSGILDRK